MSDVQVLAAPAAPDALLGVYRRAAPLFVAGAGSRLYDESGRAYLDFTSGIAVNALGHAHPVVTEAIARALEGGLIHVSNLYRSEPGERLARWLVAHSFGDAVFFCNSGAEANEAALKFARRRARAAHGPERTEIVALGGSFHGRTMGALSLTDRPAYREPFAPLVADVRLAALGDRPGDVAGVVDPTRTAAVFVEPIQGEGGVRPVPVETLRALREACDAAGALLIFDEVQVGLGRTGRLWAHEAAGVAPDLMTLAKPLAGGLPMGAVVLTRAVADAIRPGDHGTTFGGGPLVAAVALAVCEHITGPGFLDEVREKGDLARARLESLREHGVVTDVRGAGLILGAQTRAPAADVVARALDAGLLICSAGADVVRVLPPLTIGRDDLLAGLDILEECL